MSEFPSRKISLLRVRSTDGDGPETGPNLDEEMEKVFAMEGERFDVARLASSPEATPPEKRFNERDYSFHRKKSYPHTHVPLKAIHSRSMKKRSSVPGRDSSESNEVSSGDAQKRSPSLSEKGVSEAVAENGGEISVGQSIPAQDSFDDSSQAPKPSIPPTPPPVDFKTSNQALNEGSSSPAGCQISSPDCEESSTRDVLFSSGSEPQISERAATLPDASILSSSPDRRVQFEIDGIEEEHGTQLIPLVERKTTTGDAEDSPQDSDKRSKRRHSGRHYYHHKSRKHSTSEDPKKRKRSGAEYLDKECYNALIAQIEEDTLLQDIDREELARHRYDIAKGKRRYSTKTKNQIPPHDALATISRFPYQVYKKFFDHSPHEIFVQLDELCGTGEDREWKETARWIKYEEDVEEGAERWGQPHVASLSFHSLLNLRRCLETGVVLLDLEEKDLPGVAYRVVEKMVTAELINPGDHTKVMRALLLRHRHVENHDRFKFSVRRNNSSYTSLQSEEGAGSLDEVSIHLKNNNIHEDSKHKIKVIPSASNLEVSTVSKVTQDAENKNGLTHHAIDMKEETTYMSSSEDLSRKAQKESILKRIPVDAEATTVLVGAVDFLEQPTIAFVRLAEGILLPSITEVTIPVRFMFILLGPPDAELDYHEIGRSISTLMSNVEFHKSAYKATERKDLLSAINEFLDCSIVLPPGDWERQALLPFRELKAKSEAIRRRQIRAKVKHETQKALASPGDGGKKPPIDPLQRTKRPFGGLFNDMKRRFPLYASDFKDGLNLQCLAAAIFMYFAALSGAIAFGGLLADKTSNLMGISETLVSTAIMGVIFALFAGQPLVIIGTTGPLLLFDESLFSFCKKNNVEFLTMRVYIGFWLGVIALLVAAVEGSVFVKVFTRFSEEIFSSLISLLYIHESLLKILALFYLHPLLTLDSYCAKSTHSIITRSAPYLAPSNNSSSHLDVNARKIQDPIFEPKVTNQPNTALFCLILALGTFFIAYYLRHFRNSKFLGRSARRALGDFGVPIAIVTMVALDYFNPQTYTEKLKVPEGLSPSNPEERSWIIPPTGVHLPVQTWTMFAACIPALLVYILLFMETHICELIIDKKERKLKKGSGFHLDIVLVCMLNVGCGLMGAPWMCAATVRSVTHVSSVTVMSRTHAPGEKPHIIDVKEQRVSALIVSVSVGLSVLMSPLLRLVPMSVLFGVFLYMGISSLNGVQFFERLRLFFMPVKHHSQATYVRKVQTMKMHLFTIIQLLCLVVLWIVKSTAISLAFPFFLILMIPLRAQLRFIFTPAELRALDSDEPDVDDKEDEPDFYTEALLPG
nr:PREDICTED: band 3 anion exchange protein isoform X1 [Bemisia tabaci]XP_018917359.1 PREDICTED: band 3 anion exchange protein isoform X1 [Bemisia tabaci]XP_018917360.1 PREDICTED: band 3 anion exchange protein isoform X1 [Bemisia tabaci]